MGLIDFSISSAYYLLFIVLVFFFINTYVHNFLYDLSTKYYDFKDILRSNNFLVSFSKNYVGCISLFNNTFCNYLETVCSFNYTGELIIFIYSDNYLLEYENCTYKNVSNNSLYLKCNRGSFCLKCFRGICMVSNLNKFKFFEKEFYKSIEDYTYFLYVRK